MKSPLLTVRQVAERLNVSQRSAFRLVRQMPHVKLGGSVRVTEEALERFVQQRTVTPEPWSPHDVLGRPKRLSGSTLTPSWHRPIVPRTKPKP